MTVFNQMARSVVTLPTPLTDVLFYSHLNEYPSDNTRIFNSVTQQDVSIASSNVAKTTTDAYTPDVAVCSFNGTSAAFDVPLREQILTSDFTIECWLRISVLTSSSVYMVMAYGNNGASSGNIAIGMGVQTLKAYTPTDWGVNNITNLTIPTNQWFHFCAMRKTSRLYRYVNGVTDATVPNFGKSLTFNTLTIGAYTSGTRRFYNGLMSEIAVTKYAKYPTSGFTPKYPLYG